MLKKLKQHWNVNGLNLFLIIATFALGGSLCGYAGRRILLMTGLDKGVMWAVLYIVMACLLWPACVTTISIPLGQFNFFFRYILRIRNRVTGRHLKRIAVFASGTGSNAQAIIDHFRNSARAEVALIVCNKPGAGVLSVAARKHIPALTLKKEEFISGGHCISELEKHRIDLIVLAGFLWKVPPSLIGKYPHRIVNIHPALLPKYGGRGMYGHFVHEAVIRNGEKESGITIHYVDEQYDHGNIIFQEKCRIDEQETPESLAKKIHALEHTNYAAVIEKLISDG